jgi:transposase-like protein
VKDNEASEEYLKDGKHCPNCKAPYEKNGGCAHKRCAKCGGGFNDPI